MSGRPTIVVRYGGFEMRLEGRLATLERDGTRLPPARFELLPESALAMVTSGHADAAFLELAGFLAGWIEARDRVRANNNDAVDSLVVFEKRIKQAILSVDGESGPDDMAIVLGIAAGELVGLVARAEGDTALFSQKRRLLDTVIRELMKRASLTAQGK